MKKLTAIFCLMLVLALQNEMKAQLGVFRVLNSGVVKIGYDKYGFLSFGLTNPNGANGAWGVEHWDGGLNFWKPWPSVNPGNYKMFLSDEGFVGINMKPFSGAVVNRTSNFRLQVNGNVLADGFVSRSDLALKTNILNIDNALSKIISLQPKSYQYKSDLSIGGTTPTSDENLVKNNTIKNDANSKLSESNTVHYGLIAQEVQAILPNIVYKLGDYNCVNYVELIPLLINGIKEQQVTIEALKQEVATLKGNSLSLEVTKTKLFQNDPNPFTQQTTFSYYIDEKTSFTSASIEIRDIMGNLKTSLPLGDKSGIGKIEYNSNLTPGYYIFSLKIDTQTKDSKMLLVE